MFEIFIVVTFVALLTVSVFFQMCVVCVCGVFGVLCVCVCVCVVCVGGVCVCGVGGVYVCHV